MRDSSARLDRWGRGPLWLAIALVAALAGVAFLLARDGDPAGATAGTQISASGVAGTTDPSGAVLVSGETPRTIQVTGTALVEVAPDRATFVAGVEREADSADAARQQASDGIGRIIAALRDAGVPEDRLQSNGLQVEPRYDDDSDTVTGYRAGADVVVTIDDLEKVGVALDAAGEAGANRIESVQFTLKDPSAVQRDALTRAAADGRAQAEAIAQGAGVQLGEVVSISTGGSSQPYAADRDRAAAPVAADAAEPTVVAPGTLSGRVSVSIAFEIA